MPAALVPRPANMWQLSCAPGRCLLSAGVLPFRLPRSALSAIYTVFAACYRPFPAVPACRPLLPFLSPLQVRPHFHFQQYVCRVFLNEFLQIIQQYYWCHALPSVTVQNAFNFMVQAFVNLFLRFLRQLVHNDFVLYHLRC